MKIKAGIGVDIGGTAIKYGLVDTKGTLLWNSKRPTQNIKSSRKEIEQNTFDAIFEVIEISKKIDVELLAVGVGTPGLVKDKNTVLGGAFNLVGWENIPLGDIISERVNLPTYVANDADMMGTGEFWFLADRSDTVIFITIGTGIGGSIFIDGKLFGGYFGMGGELGVFPMMINDKILNWEDFASTSAMVKMYKSKCIDEIRNQVDGELIVRRFFDKEPLAVEVIEKVSKYIAMGVAGYINALNPKKVIIGGGILTAGDLFIDKIRKKVAKFALKECFENVIIESAKLGNKAGFVGAAIYGLKNSKTILD